MVKRWIAIFFSCGRSLLLLLLTVCWCAIASHVFDTERCFSLETMAIFGISFAKRSDEWCPEKMENFPHIRHTIHVKFETDEWFPMMNQNEQQQKIVKKRERIFILTESVCKLRVQLEKSVYPNNFWLLQSLIKSIQAKTFHPTKQTLNKFNALRQQHTNWPSRRFEMPIDRF